MSSKILPVDYMAQNDNELWQGVLGNIQCCPTSNASLLRYKMPGLFNTVMQSGLYEEFESFYKQEFIKCGFSADDRGNHDFHTIVLKKLGLDTVWTTQGSLANIKESIDNDFPVVIAVDYHDGHVMIVIGYDDEGLIINDCYGVRAGKSEYYATINPGYGDTYGKNDHYSWSLLDAVFFDANGQGWCRFLIPVAKKLC